jgi:hypothetical protein
VGPGVTAARAFGARVHGLVVSSVWPVGGRWRRGGVGAFFGVDLVAWWPVPCWPDGLMAWWPGGCWLGGLVVRWPAPLLAGWPGGLGACWPFWPGGLVAWWPGFFLRTLHSTLFCFVRGGVGAFFGIDRVAIDLVACWPAPLLAGWLVGLLAWGLGGLLVWWSGGLVACPSVGRMA